MAQDAEEAVWSILGIVPGSFFLGGVGVIGWQIYQWLHYGYWPSFTVLGAFTALGITPPDTSWVGVQSMIDWWLNTPLSINLLLLSVMTCVLAVGIIMTGALAVGIFAAVQAAYLKRRTGSRDRSV